ncbi:MAG: protein kinase domain-containing protein [Candidatus Binataceae bacterium]
MIDPNTILGARYRIVRPLGGGGMKQVYLAEDTRLANRRCALAEMIDSFPDPAEAQAAALAFAREADLLAQLSHDRIVRVYDKFSESNRHYLVMEHVEGDTLDQLLTAAPAGRLEEKFVIEVALQILAALEYLHGQTPPIVYRDLKPANVMVTPAGGVKLIDFGVARLFVPKKTATMVGTLGYAPPEQYEGKAEPRSDIYALGATMYHLLTGWDPGHHAPFMIPPIGTLRKDLNPGLAALLAETLMLDPNRRVSSAAAFRRALEAMIRLAGAPSAPAAPKTLAADASEPTLKKAGFSTAPTVVSIPRLLCPKCGHAVALAVRYCTYCRADLKELTERKAKTARLDVRWKFSANGEIRALAAAGGAVYAGLAGARELDGSLCAIDAAGGRLKWSFGANAAVAALAPGPNGTVYAGIAGGGLREGSHYALTPMQGGPKRSFASAYAATAIAVGPEGIVYAAGGAEDGSEGGEVIAIKPPWGSEKWSFSAARPISAVAVGPDGRSVYACSANLIYALEAESGNCKWSFVTSRHLRWSVALSGDASRQWSFISGSRLMVMAIGADGAIYAGSDDGNVYAIGAYGNFRWSYAAGDPVRGLAAGSDGIVYAGAGGKIYAIRNEGSLKWSFAAPDAAGPIAADRDGTIYATVGDRAIYAFESAA